MSFWNASFEVEKVKQLALITSLLTHHGKTSAVESLQQTESLFAKNREPFFNAIGQDRPIRADDCKSALLPLATAFAT
jgi:hypothetical protein